MPGRTASGRSRDDAVGNSHGGSRARGIPDRCRRCISGCGCLFGDSEVVPALAPDAALVIIAQVRQPVSIQVPAVLTAYCPLLCRPGAINAQ
jgi:hypothetical protein